MTGLIGILVLPALAWLLSTHRRAINWRTVGGAFGVQAAFGALVLYLPAGEAALGALATTVASVLELGRAGSEFLFGELVGDSFGFVFAFQVLPTIVFFAALISVLYHIGVMHWIVRLIGGLLQRVLGTSRPESLAAAANIFVGLNEAPLVVRPFLRGMTRSELFAVMVGGLATIAGAVMGGYAAMGIELKYLIAACFMTAPGGLMMAKIIVPEMDSPKNDVREVDAAGVAEMRSVNLIDAAASGAQTGLRIAAAVAAMLIAFIGLIAVMNGLTGWLGGFSGAPELTIQEILGWLFRPVAWLIGVPWQDTGLAGSFIGQKLVANELVAYLDYLRHREALTEPTRVIVIFALCGFANLSSVAILLGGLGTLAPQRRQDIARLGLKALLAASLANLMNGALAGVYFSL